MARARNIKPGFFKNEILAELPAEVRLLFMGLWCLADREGRFEDRPKKIKMELFPCDDFSIDNNLQMLADSGFIVRYEVAGSKYCQVVNFTKHQMPHHKEVPSEIPAPPGFSQVTKHSYDVSKNDRESVFERDGKQCLRCGATDGLSLDHIIPLASGGDNSLSNLQTLCKSRNSSKGNTTKDYRIGNVHATLTQRKTNDGDRCPSDSLIPDSLNLIPDSIEESPRKRSDTPSGVSDSVWQDFKKLRKAKKAAITETAITGIQREANKAGVTLEQALKTCCERGWTGFNADWVTSKQSASTGETPYQRTMRERFEEASGRKASNIIDITPPRMEALS